MTLEVSFTLPVEGTTDILAHFLTVHANEKDNPTRVLATTHFFCFGGRRHARRSKYSVPYFKQARKGLFFHGKKDGTKNKRKKKKKQKKYVHGAPTTSKIMGMETA